MQKLPDDLNRKFTQRLIDRNLPKPEQYFCTKWLRYYWDFCHKYYHNPFLSPSLPLFLDKLQEKRQSIQQQNQARFAIGLLYEMNLSPPIIENTMPIHIISYQIEDNNDNINRVSVAEATSKPDYRTTTNVSVLENTVSDDPQLKSAPISQYPSETSGQSWVPVFEQLENEIKLRHYSPKTLKAYRTWTR